MGIINIFGKLLKHFFFIARQKSGICATVIYCRHLIFAQEVCLCLHKLLTEDLF